MKILYSISCGLIMLPAESDSEPTLVGVDDPIPDSVADNVSMLALISDWQEMEADTLESAQDDIRNRYWRYWVAQLLGELIVGLPSALERDTITYLDNLLTSKVLQHEAVGDLLQAPLAQPESARRLASVASGLGCKAVAKALQAVVEIQPRFSTLFHTWRSLSAEHFAALGLPREELWRRLVNRSVIPTLLAAPQVEFLDRWLRCTLDEVDESISPQIRQALKSAGQDLEELLYRKSAELRAYYQKHYEYSYQGTLWDGAARILVRSYLSLSSPPGQIDPACESAETSPLALQARLGVKPNRTYLTGIL